MKLLVTWLQWSGSRGHLTSNWGVFGVIWGQNPKIFKLRQLIYSNGACGPLITKNSFRGHSTPKLGVFGVIWGQNSKLFKSGQTIYQNDALGPMINIKWFSRSSEVIRPQIGGYLGSFWIKMIPPIASSEARDSVEEIEPSISSSEARG